MDELGIEKYAFYRAGRSVDDTDTGIGAPGYLDYLQARQRLNNMAMTVPVDRPWDAPNADLWDAMTLQEWMDQNMWTEGGKILISADPWWHSASVPSAGRAARRRGPTRRRGGRHRLQRRAGAHSIS